jgi:O-antigen ligase
MMFVAILLLFAPLAMGAVQGWAIGFIFLLALAAAVSCLLHGDSVLSQRTPLDRPLAALAALAAYSLIYSAHRFAGIAAIAQLSAYIFLYYITIVISRERPLMTFLLYWIVGISTLLCLIGLARHNGVSLLPWLDMLGLPQSPRQLTATFWNHNHLAGWLEMSIPMLICLISFGCQREWLPVQVLLLLLQGVCLILTFSRGGWAGTLTALGLIAGWLVAARSGRRGRIILLAGSIAAAVAVLLLASPAVVQRLHEADLADRMLAWRGTINMILAHWRVGSGPGTYASAFAQFQPPGSNVRYDMAHNDYLQFTAELGLGLPVLIIWMGFSLYRHGLRKMKSPSRLERAVTLGSLSGITAILVHSVADFNLHVPANALLFSVLAAFAARHH